MSHSSITKVKRIVTGIIAILMLSIVLLSAFFIAHEADHDCCGEDCQICSFLIVCENTLRHAGGGIAATAFIIFSFIILFVSKNPAIKFIRQETPVSIKVRLNN